MLPYKIKNIPMYSECFLCQQCDRWKCKSGGYRNSCANKKSFIRHVKVL